MTAQRYHHHMSAEDKLDALLQSLDPRQKRALLRHPAWYSRCDCGQYGLPYAAALVVVDDDSAHAAGLCQPRREWIDQRP